VPNPLTVDNAWINGIFESNGCVCISVKNNIPQLTISIANKHYQNLEIIRSIFNGNIYFLKSGYGHYNWQIQSKKDVLNFIHYLLKTPLYTTKKQKLNMIKKYYEIKNLKKTLPLINYEKIWKFFFNKWKNIKKYNY
jgi:hypothetical protein